ncbi:MAG: hypothetical protein HY367_01020 [Candidatus Aenigmarchaeota archaeon]|nr:hypothetical protein [Candidatus Aenigmarchaeota archaeon]
MCNGALETCSSCPPDCGTCPPPFCGDRACNGVETCSTCSIDCGTCEEQPYRCGDGRCTVPETCSSCSQDCGLCSSPDTITDSAPTSGCNGVTEGGTCTISFTYNDASGSQGDINKADGIVELAIGADTSAGKDPTPTFLGLSCTGGAKVAVLSVIYTASGWTPPPNTPPGARIKDDGPLPPVTVNWNLEACAGGAGDWDVADTATSVSLGTFTLNDWASFTIQPAPSGGACGNGTVDVGLGEQCDDGNILPGDGCGPTCLLELACNGNTTCDPGESCNTCIADCGPCIPILPNATELPDDKAVLIKSVVAWAAGDRYDVLAGRVATNPVSARYIKILNRDFYQPMEIILTLGSKF